MAVVCFLEGFKQPSYMRWTLADTRILEKLFFFFRPGSLSKNPMPPPHPLKNRNIMPYHCQRLLEGGLAD